MIRIRKTWVLLLWEDQILRCKPPAIFTHILSFGTSLRSENIFYLAIDALADRFYASNFLTKVRAVISRFLVLVSLQLLFITKYLPTPRALWV